MELALDLVAVLLNICLGVAALVLMIVFSGSAFSNLPGYMLILALSLTAHTLSKILLSGPLWFFVYGLTAAIASLSYLLIVYGLFIALKNISERESA